MRLQPCQERSKVVTVHEIRNRTCFGSQRRHIYAAFLTGATLAVATLVVLANNYAGAMGGYHNPTVSADPAAATFNLPPPAPNPSITLRNTRFVESDNATRSKRKAMAKKAGNSAFGLAVCVRLCDGSFFPSNTAVGGDAACNAQCPDAPTALYTEPAGSDKIEDAVSTTGALYTALPVALRNRATLDETCTCHRDQVSYSQMLLHDYTLHKDDVVMTPKGFIVFQGKKASAIRRDDFVALAGASSLPAESRAALTAMQNAGEWDRQVGGYGSASSSASSSTSENVTRRSRVGSIWIETSADISGR
jgi:hypothetical protein